MAEYETSELTPKQKQFITLVRKLFYSKHSDGVSILDTGMREYDPPAPHATIVITPRFSIAEALQSIAREAGLETGVLQLPENGGEVLVIPLSMLETSIGHLIQDPLETLF